MSLLVDAIAGWLTQAIGDASLRTGVRLTLGSHEERQLRAALELAVDRTVNQAPASCRAALRSALDENVTGTVAWAADQEGRLIDELRAAVRAEIAPLTDSSMTGHDRSFCEIIGISPGWLLRVLPEEVIRSVTRLAATRAGTLAPLASQLNADATLEGLVAISQLLMETPAAASVRNLPPDVRAFTGRIPELARIRTIARSATSDRAIVTITAIDGMAGVGKTALAIHVAHELAPEFPDGQILLNLHGFTPGQRPIPPDVALEGLLRVIGVTSDDIPIDLESRSALWRAKLTGKRMLIILDNAGTSSQIQPLIPGAPGSLVLITSRERLSSLPEAQSVSVDILQPSDAVDLFRRMVAPQQISGDGEAVARIVQACGYLPLAISLLAGRLRHHLSWNVLDLEQELSQERYRLEVMRGDDSSVASAFELSYSGLTEAEREMFRHLGLYPGPEITPTIAGSLADIPTTDAARTLDSLFMHNLLQEISSRRYRLHDLLREYARTVAVDAVSPEVAAAAMERVLDRFLAIVQHIDEFVGLGVGKPGYQPADVLQSFGIASLGDAKRWIEQERTNLLACIAYASQHDHSHHVYAFAQFISTHLGRMGYIDDELAVQRSVLNVARRHDNRQKQAEVLLAIAHIEAGTDRYDSALGHFSQSQAIFAELGDRAKEAECLRGIAGIGYLMGNFPQAMRYYEQAILIHRELGSRRGEVTVLVGMAGAQYMLGQLDEALRNYNIALSAYREFADRRNIAQALLGVAIVRGLMGQPQQSLDAYYEVLAIRESLGRQSATAEALSGIAGAESQLGRHEDALTHYGMALSIHRDAGSRLGEAQALLGIADVKAATGDYHDAENYYNRAQAVYGEIGNRGGRAHTLRGLADVLKVSGRAADALDNYYEARAIFHDIEELPSEMEIVRRIAAAELALGHFNQAATMLKTAHGMLAQLNPADTAEIEAELTRINGELRRQIEK